MNYYFIAGLNEDGKRKLRLANIAFVRYEVNNVDGVIVDFELREEILRALNATVNSEEATEIDGVTRMNLSFRTRLPFLEGLRMDDIIINEPQREYEPFERMEYYPGRSQFARRIPILHERGERIEMPDMRRYGPFTDREEKEEEKKPEVTFGNYWNEKTREIYRKAAGKFLLERFGKSVVLYTCSGETREPQNDGSIHVFFHSALRGESVFAGKKETPAKLFGIQTDRRQISLIPSGKGIVIYDEDLNEVAEIVDFCNIYILHDIAYSGTINELNILKKTLEQVITEMEMTPKERDVHDLVLLETRRKIQKKEYVRECAKRHEKNVQMTKQAIIKKDLDVAELQSELVKSIREGQGLRLKYEQLVKSYDREKEEEKLAKEFDTILAMDKVVDVQVRGGVISVFTKTLYCVDNRDGVEHEMGTYRIDIQTDGKDHGVKWFNLTRRVAGIQANMNAPHVYEDGHACLGNMNEIIPSYIANYEFAVVMMLAIQFVESANTSDPAGKYVNNWPISQRYLLAHPEKEDNNVYDE